MQRRLWFIFAAIAMIAAIALFRYDPEPAAALESATVPSASPVAVRVSHEFVMVEFPAPATQPVGRPSMSRRETIVAMRAAGGPVERRDTLKASNRGSDPAVRPASSDQNLLERAGRAIVGDGKYRPQPFPRIR